MPTKSPRPRGDNVVIIGGGATGALTAVQLAEAGFNVTVLEQGNIGNGSSSRSAACIRAQFDIPETVLGMVFSEHWYTDISDHLKIPKSEREEVITKNGYLFLYEDEDATELWHHDLRRSRKEGWKKAMENAKMQQDLGLPVEVLDMNDVSARWPHLDGDRMNYMIGATWCPTDGFLKHDLIYRLGFHRARELGVTILVNTKVVGAKIGADRKLEGVYLADGQFIPADVVVNATNAWAPRVSESLGGVTLPIKPIKRYLTSTNAPADFDQEVWRKLPMTIYGLDSDRIAYSRPDGMNLMCGWAHKTHSKPDFDTQDQDIIEPGFAPKDSSGGETYAHALLAQIAEHAPSLVGEFPRFAGVGITCGFYGDTPDHNPLIGWDPQVKGLMHACGFSGHGLMHAPITAALVTGLIAKTYEDIVLHDKKEQVIWLPAPWRSEGRSPLCTSAFAVNRSFDKLEGKVL